jgi:2-hydroxychromene-2-carboxylate isomerase
MTTPIEFFFDFSSPYAYFASVSIEALAGRVGRSVVFKPILLGPAFKASGNIPLMKQPLKGPYSAHDWARMGRYHGIPWVLPDPFPIATMAAGRAFYWLDSRDPALAKEFAHVAYRTYFGHGIDITDKEVVAKIAAPLGIDRTQLLAAVQDDVWKNRLREETEKAVERGVFGAPFFLVDGEPFWGCDHLGMMEEWITKGGW